MRRVLRATEGIAAFHRLGGPAMLVLAFVAIEVLAALYGGP
jgi:hypothetical protein